MAKKKFIDRDYERFFEIFHSFSNSSHMNPLYYKMDEQNRLVVGKKPVECISKVIQIPAGRNGIIKMTQPKSCLHFFEARQRDFLLNARPIDKLGFTIIFNYAGSQASIVDKISQGLGLTLV